MTPLVQLLGKILTSPVPGDCLSFDYDIHNCRSENMMNVKDGPWNFMKCLSSVIPSFEPSKHCGLSLRTTSKRIVFGSSGWSLMEAGWHKINAPVFQVKSHSSGPGYESGYGPLMNFDKSKIRVCCFPRIKMPGKQLVEAPVRTMVSQIKQHWSHTTLVSSYNPYVFM